jgi:hypothetical protein
MSVFIVRETPYDDMGERGCEKQLGSGSGVTENNSRFCLAADLSARALPR